MNRGANCRIFQLLIQYGSCYCPFLFSVLCDLLFFSRIQTAGNAAQRQPVFALFAPRLGAMMGYGTEFQKRQQPQKPRQNPALESKARSGLLLQRPSRKSAVSGVRGRCKSLKGPFRSAPCLKTENPE